MDDRQILGIRLTALLSFQRDELVKAQITYRERFGELTGQALFDAILHPGPEEEEWLDKMLGLSKALTPEQRARARDLYFRYSTNRQDA